MPILTWLSLVMLITWLLCECIPVWVKYLVLREIELYDIKDKKDDEK